MTPIDRDRVFTPEEVGAIANQELEGILACRTTEAVEASITVARYLSGVTVSHENFPIFMKLLSVRNSYVADGLIGDSDPFLFLSKIQPSALMIRSCFSILASRNQGGLSPKLLLAVMGVLQAAYKSASDGYKIYPLSVSDINSLGKHLNPELGQDEDQNRRILDILDSASKMQSVGGDDDSYIEDLAVYATRIRNAFFDESKVLRDVIPSVLLTRVDYRSDEIAPRAEVQFEHSLLGQFSRQAAEVAVAGGPPRSVAAADAGAATATLQAPELETEEEVEEREPAAATRRGGNN